MSFEALKASQFVCS